jgi:DNA polymerase I-like protein with 3'-5' exonuclease and polymerase domains
MRTGKIKRTGRQLPRDQSLQIILLNIGTVHDEIILEAPDKTANDAAAILRETMIEAGKAYLGRVPVEVEVAIGETWAEK